MVNFNEAQQIEQLKAWLREYGVPIMLGILIAIVIGFGWRFWQSHREDELIHASIRYEELVTNLVNGNYNSASIQADRLMLRYPHTPYAEFAALHLAKYETLFGHYQVAERYLRWLMNKGDTPALRETARLRLARILVSQRQLNAALELLKKQDDPGFLPTVKELEGDIYALEGKPDQARTAYQIAIRALPQLPLMQPLLQMKIDNLGVAKI